MLVEAFAFWSYRGRILIAGTLRLSGGCSVQEERVDLDVIRVVREELQTISAQIVGPAP
jgi:hypothetical protein